MLPIYLSHTQQQGLLSGMFKWIYPEDSEITGGDVIDAGVMTNIWTVACPLIEVSGDQQVICVLPFGCFMKEGQRRQDS